MGQTAASDTQSARSRPALARRVWTWIGALAAASVLISVGGRFAGHSIALAGYSDDRTDYEVVIGDNVLLVPGNAIRHPKARRDGVAGRLDLYLRWPELDGFSEAARDDFNNKAGDRRLVFLSFELRMMSRDMSGRLEPIYRSLIAAPGTMGPAGITFYDFTRKSGYANEVLAVAERGGGETFVARCLSGEGAGESLAPCERDVAVSDDLSLTYRFPRERLSEWAVLDARMRDVAKTLIRRAD